MIQAVILAGGMGTRLRPIVGDLPKPMAPVLGKPFLEYQLELLKQWGITEIVLCVGYHAQVLEDYFGDGEPWHLHLHAVEEAHPLGTAGALKNAAALLDDQFLVLNGDTFAEINIPALLAFHRAHGGLASLALTPMNDARAYGAISLDSADRITAFHEKSESEMPVPNAGPHWINAGVYLLEKPVLDFIAPDEPVSLETEIFPRLIETQSVYGFRQHSYFVDIGTPPAYKKFVQDLRTGRIHVNS